MYTKDYFSHVWEVPFYSTITTLKHINKIFSTIFVIFVIVAIIIRFWFVI